MALPQLLQNKRVTEEKTNIRLHSNIVLCIESELTGVATGSLGVVFLDWTIDFDVLSESKDVRCKCASRSLFTAKVVAHDLETAQILRNAE